MTAMTRPCAALLLVVLGGCTQTEVAGREVLRLGPYRAQAVEPAAAHAGEVKLKVAANVLTRTERRGLRSQIGQAFLEEIGVRSQGAQKVDAEARLVKCRVRAGFTKRHTVYEARCRAVLEKRATALVEVEGFATRRTRTNAVTRFDVDNMKKNPRNPAFDEDETEEVLLEAARTAARMLVDPGFVPAKSREQAALPEEQKGPDPDAELERTRAHRALDDPDPARRAAAAVDLARWGRAEDTAVLVPLLSDPSPLVRRAAAVALGELAQPAALVPLGEAARIESDARAKAAAKRSLERLCALFAGTTDGPLDDGASGSALDGNQAEVDAGEKMAAACATVGSVDR